MKSRRGWIDLEYGNSWGWGRSRPEQKAVVGFAHRFRPTYPGFPVKVGGVEQLHAAFFERKPHT